MTPKEPYRWHAGRLPKVHHAESPFRTKAPMTPERRERIGLMIGAIGAIGLVVTVVLLVWIYA